MHFQVVTTTDTEREATTLAHGIVQARLGACVHIGEITSVYRWEGEVTTDREWRLTVKTAADRLPDLINYIEREHSYAVPQVVATEISAGSGQYLAWVTAQTRPVRSDR